MTTTLTTPSHPSPPVHRSPSLAREMASPISPGSLQPSAFSLQASGLGFAPPPFPIAGFRYYDGEQALPELKPGTNLTLRAETDNPHDPSAVEILHRGRKLGYVPRFCNRRVSQLLLDDVPVSCEVARISADAPPWDAVAVRVSVPKPLPREVASPTSLGAARSTLDRPPVSASRRGSVSAFPHSSNLLAA